MPAVATLSLSGATRPPHRAFILVWKLFELAEPQRRGRADPRVDVFKLTIPSFCSTGPWKDLSQLPTASDSRDEGGKKTKQGAFTPTEVFTDSDQTKHVRLIVEFLINDD